MTSECHWTQSWDTDAELWDAVRRQAEKYTIFGAHNPRNAIGRYFGLQTPSVETPFVATSINNTIFDTNEARDAIAHNIVKPTPSVATQFFETPPEDGIFFRT